MANLITVKASEREKAIAAQAAKGNKTLAGGLNLPEGKFPFHVAEKSAFGLLEVTSQSSGNWALPIVAGTMDVNGAKETFILSAEAGAKTLVIPDSFYLSMQLNASYIVEIGTRRGRKVVIGVEPAEAGATEDAE
jgi:hypothetical protein